MIAFDFPKVYSLWKEWKSGPLQVCKNFFADILHLETCNHIKDNKTTNCYVRVSCKYHYFDQYHTYTNCLENQLASMCTV